MKGSDSIVLPLAFKRVSHDEDRRKSPVRVLGGGGGNRDQHHHRKAELGRSSSSRNLERGSRDSYFQSHKAHETGEAGKDQQQLGLLAAGKPSVSSSSSTTRGSSSASRRKSESTGERFRGEVDRFPSRSRRKSAPVSTQVSPSDDSSTYGKASQKLHEVPRPNPARKASSFTEVGYSKARAGPSFCGDSSSSSESSRGSAEDIVQDKYHIVAENDDDDNSSCSSSGSVSPVSINSRLTEMKLLSDQMKRSPSDCDMPGNSIKKSSHSGNFTRSSTMGSTSGQQRDRGRYERDVAGLVGLVNEGNTCYLNSCLQCLAHSMPLASAVQGAVESSIQRRGSGNRAGTSQRDWSSLAEMLVFSFRQVVRDLWQRPAFTATSARMFLQCVQAWAPQFAGHSQHDAQEVLRAILDGLHEALNRVTTAPPYRDLYLEPKPEEELAELTWRYHKVCQDSIIQDIFCGNSPQP